MVFYTLAPPSKKASAMIKQIVLQPRFSNGNDVYVKASIVLDGKAAFTALCNPDGKISVQKLPAFKPVNIYGNWESHAMSGREAIMQGWKTLNEDTRRRAINCVNELPRSFQRLCTVMSFTTCDMVEVHNYIRDLKQMFSALQSELANVNAAIAAKAGEGTAAEESKPAGREWKCANVCEMPVELAQGLLDTFASEPEKVVCSQGSVYRLRHDGVIERCAATDAEIAEANANECASQRKTVCMAMFRPGQSFGEFEEGSLYECKNRNAQYVKVRIGGNDWRSVKPARLEFHDVYAEAPQAAAMPQA